MDDKIINKIQKLIAKAESAQELGNADEAAAFSAKVSELLTKHNLAKADISTKEEDDVAHTDFSDLDLTRKQGGWTLGLLQIISEYNFCKLVYHQGYNDKWKVVIESVSIIGAPENVEIVRYLYSMLKNQLESIGKTEWKKYLMDYRKTCPFPTSSMQYKKPWKSHHTINRGTFLKSFYLGANNGINIKLSEANSAAKAEYGTKITDLIIVTDASLNKYKDKIFGKLDQMKSSTKKVNSAAFNKGVNTGKNTSMAKGLANAQTPNAKQLN